MPDEELPFSLDWLAGAGNRPADILTVCPDGHLVIRERTHYTPLRLSGDLRSLWMGWVEHDTATDPDPDPDLTFAATLHEWLDSRPRHYTALREAVEQWLVAKGL